MSRLRTRAEQKWDWNTALLPLQALINSNTSISGTGEEVYSQLRDVIRTSVPQREDGALKSTWRKLLRDQGEVHQARYPNAPHCTETDKLILKDRCFGSTICVPGSRDTKGSRGVDRIVLTSRLGNEFQAFSVPTCSNEEIRKGLELSDQREIDVYRWTSTSIDESILVTLALDGHPGVGIPVCFPSRKHVPFTEKEKERFLGLWASNPDIRGRHKVRCGHSTTPYFLSYWFYRNDKVVTVLWGKESTGTETTEPTYFREMRITDIGERKRADRYVKETGFKSFNLASGLPADLKYLSAGKPCILRDAEWRGCTDVHGLPAPNTQADELMSTTEDSIPEADEDSFWASIDVNEMPRALSRLFRNHERSSLHKMPGDEKNRKGLKIEFEDLSGKRVRFPEVRYIHKARDPKED